LALVLRVGTTADVFAEPFATTLAMALEHHFGPGMHLRGLSEDEGWHSTELGWSWWRLLQERAAALLGPDATPHLTSMPAWRGVFLPKPVEIGEISGIPGDDGAICIASLASLLRELADVATALGVAFGEDAGRKMAAKYENPDLCDDDPELQTFAQLAIGGHVAAERGQPLWVIK
jgi:hypothetical protein